MEKFAVKHEKNVFKGLFGANSDDSDESCSSDDENASVSQQLKIPHEGVECVDEQITTFVSSKSDVQIRMVEQKLLGIAHQLWPAAKFMCEYLETNQNILRDFNSDTLNILELGAGVGLCGLFIAELFKGQYNESNMKVVLTDLPEAIDRLNQNIELNGLESTVSASVLSWGSEQDLDAVFAQFTSPPLIIAADCVYWECLFQPLVVTLSALVARGSEVVISHVKRWKRDAKFFALCRKAGLRVDTLVETVEMVPAEHTGEPTRTITRVYRIRAATGTAGIVNKEAKEKAKTTTTREGEGEG